MQEDWSQTNGWDLVIASLVHATVQRCFMAYILPAGNTELHAWVYSQPLHPSYLHTQTHVSEQTVVGQYCHWET